MRDDVYLLYLVFRTLDDLVDEGRPEAAERVAAVEAWAEARPVRPLARGRRSSTSQRCVIRLPRQALADFCAGMREDLAGADFATEQDVDRYCYRVAGTVGLVMASVLGTSRLDRASAGGGRARHGDAAHEHPARHRRGRRQRAGVYIARETVDALRRQLAPGRRAALLRDQIGRADALYERGLAGVGELRRGRRAIAAAGAMYRELLRELEREGYGARAGRASSSRRAGSCAWRRAPRGAHEARRSGALAVRAGRLRAAPARRPPPRAGSSR